MMKKVHTNFCFLLVLIIHASCSTVQHSKTNVTVDKSEAFACDCGPNTETCKFIGDKETCTCAEGFSLSRRGMCEKCDCGQNTETCEFIEDKETCTCKEGFSLNKEGICEICDCGEYSADCKFIKGEKRCICPGNFIEEEGKCIGPCTGESDCENGALCLEGEGKKICNCKPGTEGEKCDIVSECMVGGKYEKCIADAGTCTFETDKAVCTCPDAKFLDEDLGYCKERDPCAPNPCQNGGQCEKVDGKARCKCELGFTGELCDTELSCSTDSDCRNEAKCEVDFEGNKKCKCMAGTMGKTCEILTDCETGGKYENCKGEDGECTFENGIAVCKCPEWKKFDEVAGNCKDQCNPNICENGGECIVIEGQMKCKCKVPYTGDRCETKCRCENGLCVMDKHGKMKCACNLKHSLTDDETCKPCDCGNKGKCIFQMKVLNGSIQYWKMCICNKGSAEKDGKCVDCNCGPNSLCEFEGEEKLCYCEEGYTEKYGVCTGLCTDNPCKNGGTCEIRENGYNCICKEHYFGKMCEMGPCADSPCKNGGTCEVVGNDYKCTCRDPYFGKMCEMDSCTPNPCQNGGTCFVDGNMFKCACMDLVSGTTCEIDNRFLLGALLLLIILVFLIIICGAFCLFKIKQKVSQNFHP